MTFLQLVVAVTAVPAKVRPDFLLQADVPGIIPVIPPGNHSPGFHDREIRDHAEHPAIPQSLHLGAPVELLGYKSVCGSIIMAVAAVKFHDFARVIIYPFLCHKVKLV